MRAIPGITIVTPADCLELYKCIEALIGYERPVYLRLTGGVGMPIVYEKNYDFQIGKAEVLKEIKEITVLSHGTTVGHALKAVNALQDDGVDVGLVNMHTLKPLDTEVLGVVAAKSKKIIIFEEHSRIGGLGSAVLEYLNEEGCSRLDVVVYGIDDNFPKTGSYTFMLKTHGLDAAGIKEAIISSM
jgi:transketolase